MLPIVSPFTLPTTCTLEKAVVNSRGLASIKGILSTNIEDTQKEVVFIKGMDIGFLNSGYAQLNWWHLGRTNPGLIVGLIDKAEKIENDSKLYIEGHLFKNVKSAGDVYDLMKALEEEGKSMGLSVEGAVLKKENKNVYKSVASGGALTTQPVNQGCMAELIKSLDSYEISANVDEEFEELAKAISVSGTAPYGTHPLAALSFSNLEEKPKVSMEEAAQFLRNKFPFLKSWQIEQYLLTNFKS